MSCPAIAGLNSFELSSKMKTFGEIKTAEKSVILLKEILMI
jgi:hypothetical protein